MPAPARESLEVTRAPLRAVGRAAAAEVASPELWAGVRLSGIDAETLTRLAERAQRFTPRVSLAPPDGLLLEVRGSLHLFAGVTGLRAALTQDCLQLRIQPLIAFAPTPSAALAAARAGKPLEVLHCSQLTGQLAPLPLTALRWPPDTLERLKRMGVCTIGAVLRLPRAGFARRFGAAQLAMLDALTGRTPEVRAAHRPRVRFRRRRDLDCELQNHALLLAALTPLFTQLGAFLKARQCAVAELECRLLHRQAPVSCCVLRLAAPCADAQRLRELLGAQLDALRLPEPVRACELRAAALVAYVPDCATLWQAGEHGGGSVRETHGFIEHLRARLGPHAVHGLRLLAGHRPESAWAVTGPPTAAARPQAAPERGEAGRRRPLWLLPAPQRLSVRDGLPRRRGPLRLVSEPERIETGWWDGGAIARDYYTALDIHGVRLWVFRERAAPHGWYLHGVFG
ncbi:MAG: DNA polymerase Y family protein [Steroidobacteraceae bacterium]